MEPCGIIYPGMPSFGPSPGVVTTTLVPPVKNSRVVWGTSDEEGVGDEEFSCVSEFDEVLFDELLVVADGEGEEGKLNETNCAGTTDGTKLADAPGEGLVSTVVAPRTAVSAVGDGSVAVTAAMPLG
jgi:hypothetical protein